MALIDIASETAGKIWKITAQLGDILEEDDTLVILECMKMEIPILAPASGKVQAILITEGDEVSEGQILARIET